MGEVNRIEIKQPETPAEAPKAPEAPKADRPAWLPENFKSPEDLAKAFKDTQAELTRVKQGTKAVEAPKAEGTPVPAEAPTEAPAGEDLTVQKAPEIPKLDMDAFSAEYAKEGKLGEESYKRLAAIGLDKDTVDTYIEGQKVLAERMDQEAYAAAGGKEEFDRVREWLSSPAVSEEQRQAFNKSVAKGAPRAERMQAINAAIKGYRDANGYEGTMIHGRGGAVSDVYESMAQMVADMRKPEYDKDPAFRAKVEAKVKRSRI